MTRRRVRHFIEERSYPSHPAELGEASPFARALIFVFAMGVPLDVVLASRLGSSSAALGAPLVVAGALRMAQRRAIRELPPALLFLLAFTAWAAVTVLWARDLDSFETRTRTNLQLLLSVFLGWQCLRGLTDVRSALKGFVVGCSIAAMETWRTFLTTGVSSEVSRYASEGFDSNDLAVTLAIGIPMSAYLAFGPERRARLWLAYVPVALTAIVLTGSRGGIITYGAAIVAVGLWIGRRRRAVLAAVIGFVALAIWLAWTFAPEALWVRIFTINDEILSGTFNHRTVIWRAGIDVLERHLLFGVGSGGFANAVAPALSGRFVAHNTLLSVAVEEGVVGFVLFACVFASILRAAAAAGSDQRAAAWILAFVWTVGSASLTWEYRKTTWFVILVGTALAMLRSAEPSRTAVTPQPAGLPACAGSPRLDGSAPPA